MSYENALRQIEIAKQINCVQFTLANYQLDVVPHGISDLSSVVILNLKGNNLSELASDIAQLSKLKSLNISNNKFRVLPEFITKFMELKELHLEGNSLIALPDDFLSFLKATDVRVIGIRDCGIKLPYLHRDFAISSYGELVYIDGKQLTILGEKLSITTFRRRYKKSTEQRAIIEHLTGGI